MGKTIVIFVSITLSLVCFIIGNARAEGKVLAGFYVTDVRFDESMGDKMPTPIIPKEWRFVGVSNGEKMNSNNLWFQDQAGNIYLVRGFNSGSKFILQGLIGKIGVGK